MGDELQPRPEDFKPDGPPRDSFQFEMMKGDDAGQGFPMIELPKKEPDPPKRPSLEERKATVIAAARARGRRGFLLGLLVGQLLIVGINLGVPALLPYLPKNVKVEDPSRLPLLVFVGMTAGAGVLAVVMLAWMLIRRRGVIRPAFSLTVTMVVVCATAFLMIPPPTWKQVPDDAIVLGKHAWARMRGWSGK